MAVSALSSTNVERPLGGVWTITVLVTDADCGEADVTPVVTVTLPAGTTVTPTVDRLATGVYRASYELGTAGRYVARAVAAGYGAADFVAFVTATTAATSMPDVDDCKNYSKDDFGSWSDDEIQSTLDAEAANQRRECNVPAAYPADLRQALLRRVQVALTRRGQPVLVTVDGDGARQYLPQRDPEVRRLEGPHRKLVLG